MNQDIETLKQFKARMTAIARANNDSFVTTVTFDEKGYHVQVVEKADSHTFLTGDGTTFREAVDHALAGLIESLSDWGYRRPSN